MLVKAEGARFPLDHYLLTAVDRSSGYKMVHPFEVLPCKLNPDTCPSLTAFSYCGTVQNFWQLAKCIVVVGKHVINCTLRKIR